MKREIKFRAWERSSKGMWDVRELEWADGTIMSAYLGLHTSDAENFDLMQFTGLKDKNGKEIYEGDVLAIPDEVVVENIGGYDRTKPTNHLLQVEYSVGRASFGTAHGSFGEMTDNYGSPETWEVIGNIYETPDLVV